MGVTVQSTFMYLFGIHLLVGVDVCDCLKHIYVWVYLYRRHLWMGVTI